MEPAGIKGWVCRFYDRNLYWLCRGRGIVVAVTFVMAALSLGMASQTTLLPIASVVRHYAELASGCFLLLGFVWMADFRFYPLTIRSKEAYYRQPDHYKVFTFFRLLASLAILGIAILQSYKMIQVIRSAGCTTEDIVKMFFALYKE